MQLVFLEAPEVIKSCLNIFEALNLQDSHLPVDIKLSHLVKFYMKFMREPLLFSWIFLELFS